jgi:hypothetical protein
MTLPNDIEAIGQYWRREDRDAAIGRLNVYLRVVADEFHLETKVTISPQGYIWVALRPAEDYRPEPPYYPGLR